MMGLRHLLGFSSLRSNPISNSLAYLPLNILSHVLHYLRGCTLSPMPKFRDNFFYSSPLSM